ncbi:MAG: hypothetical protein ACHQF3_14745 [Alphaproteobacteria bacterium]
MARLLNLLIAALMQSAAEHGRRAAWHAVSAALIAAIAAACVLAALGCAVVALWLAMLPLVGPVAAPLIAAAALLVVAAVLLVVARRIMTGRAAPRTGAGPDADATAELARLIGEHKIAFLLSALLAGLAAGERPRPR